MRVELLRPLARDGVRGFWRGAKPWRTFASSDEVCICRAAQVEKFQPPNRTGFDEVAVGRSVLGYAFDAFVADVAEHDLPERDFGRAARIGRRDDVAVSEYGRKSVLAI